MLERRASSIWRMSDSGALSKLPRHRSPPVRQRIRRDRNSLRADWLFAQYRADPALRTDPRRCVAQPGSGAAIAFGMVVDHRRWPTSFTSVSRARAEGGCDERVQALGLARFRARRGLFLRAADRDLRILLRMRRGTYSFDAYRSCFSDPRFQATFSYSVIIGFTIMVGVAHRRARPPIRRCACPAPALSRVRHSPAADRPGDRSRLRLYPASTTPRPGCPSPASELGTNLLLTSAMSRWRLPYMYRAVDTGMRTIDVRTLTEAANILGAGWSTILSHGSSCRTSSSRCFPEPF